MANETTEYPDSGLMHLAAAPLPGDGMPDCMPPLCQGTASSINRVLNAAAVGLGGGALYDLPAAIISTPHWRHATIQRALLT